MPMAIDARARAVEAVEAMAPIATVPDAGARAIAAMRFPEGKGRETIARPMRCERPGKAAQEVPPW